MFLAASLALVSACGTDKPESQAEYAGADSTPVELTAILSPTEGNSVAEAVRFLPASDGGVIIRALVSGLDSGGRHGMHIHEFGDCSAPDGSSAGGHYNPDDAPHGAPSNPASGRHAGDLGNLIELAEGVAEFETTDRVIQLHGEDSIEGKSVIVHAGEDDFATQPTGNAGARLACGVVVREESPDSR